MDNLYYEKQASYDEGYQAGRDSLKENVAYNDLPENLKTCISDLLSELNPGYTTHEDLRVEMLKALSFTKEEIEQHKNGELIL